MEPLCQRLQPMDALGAVVEGWRPGDDQVEARETAGVHLVDELPEGVEALVADVAADPLDGLDLIEHQDQAGVPGIPHDSEHALEELKAAKWSMSPFTPAALLAPAPTFGWPSARR